MDVRRLERRAARGEPDAKMRLLARLPYERLSLAAKLGDEASRRALGVDLVEWCPACSLPRRCGASGCLQPLHDWALDISECYDHEPLVRVAVAGVQPAQDAWEVAEAKRRGVSVEARKANGDVVALPVTALKAEFLSRYGINPLSRRIVEAARLWLEDRAEGAKVLQYLDPNPPGLPPWALYLLRVVLRDPTACHALVGALGYAADSLGDGGEAKVREAVRREVVPWALWRTAS